MARGEEESWLAPKTRIGADDTELCIQRDLPTRCRRGQESKCRLEGLLGSVGRGLRKRPPPRWGWRGLGGSGGPAPGSALQQNPSPGGGAGNAAGGACGTPPPWQQGEGPGRAAGILGASSGNFYCQNATFGVMFLTVFYRPGGGSHFSTNFLPPMWLNKKKETRLGLFSLPVATKRCALRAGGGGRGGTPRAARPRGARPAAPAQWGGRRCDRAHVARRAPARPAPPPASRGTGDGVGAWPGRL